MSAEKALGQVFNEVAVFFLVFFSKTPASCVLISV